MEERRGCLRCQHGRRTRRVVTPFGRAIFVLCVFLLFLYKKISLRNRTAFCRWHGRCPLQYGVLWTVIILLACLTAMFTWAWEWYPLDPATCQSRLREARRMQIMRCLASWLVFGFGTLRCSHNVDISWRIPSTQHYKQYSIIVGIILIVL